MYNPNVPSSNMGIAPISGQPSQPLGPTPMVGPAPMGPMGPPPPPMMAPPPMAPPIAPITEGLGGFGGSSAGRAGFSERMQRMTAPPKPKPMPQPMPVQRMSYGGMVGSGIEAAQRSAFAQSQRALPDGLPSTVSSFGSYQNPMFGRQAGLGQQGSVDALDQYGDYLDNQYGDPQFEQKRDNFLQGIAHQEQQTFGGMGGYGGQLDPTFDSTQRERSLLDGIYGSGGLSNYQVAGARPMANGGSVSSDPVKMALGGFIGNPLTRDYNRDFGGSDSSYEDEAYGDDGYGRVDYGGGDSGGDDSGGGDDDDYYDYLDDDYVYVPPVPDVIGPPVVVPEPESDGDDIKDRVIADLVYGSADPTVGPNNAQEALDQASADFKAGRSDVADMDLATLSSRISRGRDVMPARLSSVDAISRDFAVPAPEDTTFSDPDEIFDLRNPISLNAAQVVGPNSRTDASGNLIPGRADTKADIEAGTEAALSLGPEVMSSDPSMGSSGVPLSQLPTSIGGMVDKPVVGTAFSPASPSSNATMMPSFLPEVIDPNTPLAPKMALPGDIPTQSTQSFNIPNRVDAGRAALDLLRAEEKRGITSLSNMAEKNEELRKELEILQGRAGERFANNIDEATSFYKPEGTGMDAFNQMLSDPANYEINRVGRLSPEELAQSPFGETEAKFVVPPIGAPITDAELSEARKIYGDFDPTLGAPYVAPPSDIQLEMAQPTDGGLTAGGIADLLEATPGMANYLQRFTPSTGDPKIYADPSNFDPNRPSTYKEELGGGEGYNPPVVAPSVTLEGMGIDPANYPTEEGLRRDREKYKTPGVGDVATAEIAKRFNEIYESNQQPNVSGDSATYQDADGNYRNPAPNEVTFPAEGGVLNRDDVIAYKRGILSGEPTVASADPAQTVPATATATAVPASTDGAAIPNSDIATDSEPTDEVFIDPTDSEMYFRDRFEPNAPTRAFESLIKALSFGAIDLGEISAKQREKGFEAYKKTQTLAYDEKGRVIGVKDPEGKTILLGPQPQDDDDTGGDDDGCPPGFRRINGVCTPIQRIARNPATSISDSINKATLPVIPLPSTLRPIVRDVVDDEDEEEETSDVGGLTIRRPKYFAGGGAVSEGMGSAIDSFISAMGGSVKKKSNVAPVGMARGGYVDMQTKSGSTVKDGFGNPVRTRVTTSSMSESDKDERNFSYDPFPDDVYGRGGRGVNLDPVAPAYNFYADAAAAPVYPDIMSSGFFNPEPEPDNIVKRSLRPQLRPASFDPYVNNAISSVQDNFNDGTVGPTMQNAAALPKQETFMQGISNYLPASVNSAFMLGPNYDQSVFGAAGEMGGELATSFYDDVIGPEGKPLEYLGGAAVDLGRSVFDTLYDPPKAVYGAVDSVFDAFGRLGTETNARDRVGNIIGGPLAAATAVTPLGRLGKLTPKNNTISTDIKPTFKNLNLAHGTPRTDPFKPEIQVQMADGTTQFMDMFSPDGLIETKFTSGFPEGAKVIGDHPFGRFSTDFIGAGEGRMLPGSSASSSNPRGAAFGKGVYFAENPELSTDSYRFIDQRSKKPDGLPKNFSLDAALRQKQGIINKYGSPEEALEAFKSGQVISKPDFNSVSQAYFQGAENALKSDNPILSKISSDLMSGMEPSYRDKLERLKIEKPEEWQTIISNHINGRINSILKKGREDQLAKGQKIVDDPDIQRASNILNKNAMDTRNRVYDEKASYDAMLQIMQSGVLPYNTPNIPGSTKRATINESKLGRSLDLDSPSAVGDTRIGFDKNVRQDMLDIFGEAWVADRESGMFADPKNPGNLLRGAPNQTDYRTEGAYAPRTVEEMNKLADAGYSHLSFYDGKSREVHRRATKRMQDIQKQLEGTTLERYLSYANKNNPQDVAEMTKLYEVEVANLENEMKKARESLTGLTKNYVFFDDKTMPKITESYAKGGQVGMGLGSL